MNKKSKNDRFIKISNSDCTHHKVKKKFISRGRGQQLIHLRHHRAFQPSGLRNPDNSNCTEDTYQNKPHDAFPSQLPRFHHCSFELPQH